MSSLYASNSGIYPVFDTNIKKTKKQNKKKAKQNKTKCQYFSSYIQDFQ